MKVVLRKRINVVMGRPPSALERRRDEAFLKEMLPDGKPGATVRRWALLSLCPEDWEDRVRVSVFPPPGWTEEATKRLAEDTLPVNPGRARPARLPK